MEPVSKVRETSLQKVFICFKQQQPQLRNIQQNCRVKRSRQKLETLERLNNVKRTVCCSFNGCHISHEMGVCIISGTANRDPLIKNAVAVPLIRSPLGKAGKQKSYFASSLCQSVRQQQRFFTTGVCCLHQKDFEGTVQSFGERSYLPPTSEYALFTRSRVLERSIFQDMFSCVNSYNQTINLSVTHFTAKTKLGLSKYSTTHHTDKKHNDIQHCDN